MHRDSPDKADPAESTVNLQIVACEPCHCADFVRLSRLWLDEYFCVEAEDEQIFADPIAAFAPGGGGIFVARDEASGRVAGVCALAYHARTGDWELAKLCVDPAFRGHGAGKALVQRVIAEARERGARRLVLDTNSRLTSAIRLYRRCGFVDIPLDKSPFSRTDRRMSLDLR